MKRFTVILLVSIAAVAACRLGPRWPDPHDVDDHVMPHDAGVDGGAR